MWFGTITKHRLCNDTFSNHRKLSNPLKPSSRVKMPRKIDSELVRWTPCDVDHNQNTVDVNQHTADMLLGTFSRDAEYGFPTTCTTARHFNVGYTNKKRIVFVGTKRNDILLNVS